MSQLSNRFHVLRNALQAVTAISFCILLVLFHATILSTSCCVSSARKKGLDSHSSSAQSLRHQLLGRCRTPLNCIRLESRL